MSELYFYHAPDDRIYGPVDRAKLQEWEREGRLVPSSRLQRKDTQEFKPWIEIRSSPPLVQPVSPPSDPVLEAEASPLLPPTLKEFPSTAAILRESTRLYAQHFWPLFLLCATFEFPIMILGLFPETDRLGTSASTLSTRELILVFVIMLSAVILRELSLGATVAALDRLNNQKKLTPQEIWSLVLNFLGPIALSLLPRIILPICGLIPSCLFFSAANSLSHSVSALLLIILGLMFLIPPCLLSIRLMLTTPVIIFEGRPVIAALQRSSLLISQQPRTRLISSGEAKILVLILVPFLLTFAVVTISLLTSGLDWTEVAANPSATLPPLDLMHSILRQLVMFFGASLISPLYAAIIYCYYEHASAQAEEV